MSTTGTPESLTSDRVQQLEAELQAFRENAARAHRQLHEDLSGQLAVLTTAYETLHRNHAQLKMNLELERRQRRKYRQKANKLRNDLARVRRERDAARAALRRSPGRRAVAGARKLVARLRTAARAS
jgi:chromosome segregation ATPase